MAALAEDDARDAIARRLDALREERAWSLSELARRAGVKLGVLSTLHRGRRQGRNMKLWTAMAVCKALGVKVGKDLLGEEDLPLPLPVGMDLAQLSQPEKDTLIIHLLAEVLQRGLQIPPVLTARSDNVPEPC